MLEEILLVSTSLTNKTCFFYIIVRFKIHTDTEVGSS